MVMQTEMDCFSHWTLMSPKFQEEEARLGPSYLEPRPWESTAFLSAWPGFSSSIMQEYLELGEGMKGHIVPH